MTVVDNNFRAVIKVVGVGGGGGNAVNSMIEEGLIGVDFIAINTDSQALLYSDADVKLSIGEKITRGLGAGANPEVGRQAAEEARDSIEEVLVGADMVFVTVGEGGGTGTGAAPLVAETASKLGALTVGVVTMPFSFEGKRRRRQAEEGVKALRENCDAVICIQNDKLRELGGSELTVENAFQLSNQVLVGAVKGISDLIVVPGIINVDFADVRSVIANAGTAVMGVGVAKGEDRCMKAARMAVESPLLDVSIDGAVGTLITFAGSNTMRLDEISDAADYIQGLANEDVNFIFGTTLDDNLGDEVRVTIVATGFDEESGRHRKAADNAKASTQNNDSSIFGIQPDQTQKPSYTTESSGVSSLFGNSSETPNYSEDRSYESHRDQDSEDRDRRFGGSSGNRNIDIPWG